MKYFYIPFLLSILFLSIFLSGCGADLSPIIEEVGEVVQEVEEVVQEVANEQLSSEAEPDKSNEEVVSEPAEPRTVAEPNQSESAEPVTCTIEIDRSGVPDLLFQDVTLLIDVGNTVPVAVLAAGNEAEYSQEGANVMITTPESTIELRFENITRDDRFCQTTITPLRENKKWAWSIGFDDNVGLQATVAGFQTLDYRGTLFMIGASFEAERDEDWIIDEPALQPLLEEGWALGNHGYESVCYLEEENAAGYETDLVQGEEHLLNAIARSVKPEFKMLTFAAPCFDTNYDPVMEALIDEGRTGMRLNESGNFFIQQVGGAGSITYPEEINIGEVPRFDVNEDFIIGRDVEIEWDPDNIIMKLNWIAEITQGDNRIWYNSLAHGGNEENVLKVAQYIHDTYDEAGDRSVWVDTSTNIYSYLVTREFAQISVTVAEN